MFNCCKPTKKVREILKSMSVNDLEANPSSINQPTDEELTQDEEEKGDAKFGDRTFSPD